MSVGGVVLRSDALASALICVTASDKRVKVGRENRMMKPSAKKLS